MTSVESEARVRKAQRASARGGDSAANSIRSTRQAWEERQAKRASARGWTVAVVGDERNGSRDDVEAISFVAGDERYDSRDDRNECTAGISSATSFCLTLCSQ